MNSQLRKLVSVESWGGLRKRWQADVHDLGVSGAAKLGVAHAANFIGRLAGILPRWPVFHLRSSAANHAIGVRAFGSDLYVVRQVLVDREHASVADIPAVRLIVDCGANVGYASAFLLSRHPTAHVIAVEPDECNYALLVQNLAPYGSRARCVRAAVSGVPGRVRTVRGEYRDGLDWSITVTPDEAGDTPAVTIGQIIDESGFNHIDLLKIDIEGAETAVFDGDSADWLDRTSNLCVELHGAECERSFRLAMERYDFEMERTGELFICRRIRPRGVKPELPREAADGKS